MLIALFVGMAADPAKANSGTRRGADCLTVKLSDTTPGMRLLDQRHNKLCTIVGVNHDVGLIWLTGEESPMLRKEFDERGYARQDAVPAVVHPSAVG